MFTKYYITFLLFLTISALHVSCEGEEQQAFSIDQCIGKYVCKIEGQTLLVLPGGRTDAPSPPLTNYPKEGTVVTVTKTGEYELTLTLEDRVMVAQVDEMGKLTIPDATIYLENENFTMSLTAEYTLAYITHDRLFVKQVASGKASCNDKGDKYTLTVTNTQFFEGKK